MNRAIAAIGVAKQANKATAAANPTFWHGVSSGAMAGFEPEDVVADVTTGLDAPALAYRDQVTLPVGFTTLTFARAIGLYILGVLGNVQTTGEGAIKTHVFTLASDIPWLAFFSELDGWRQRNGASKIDELVFEWDASKPLRITLVAQGCTFALPETITLPDPNEVLGSFFRPVGKDFKIDVDGDTPVAALVSAGRIAFKRSSSADFFSGSITPGDIGHRALEIESDLTVRLATWADWRSIATGSPTGTAAGTVPVIGSYDIGFTAGADEELLFAASRVMFTATPPEADPAGGPVDLQLKGRNLIAAAGQSPITVTLKNGVVAY